VRPRLVGDLLATLNEPTHLRILNSVSRVPAARQRSRARLDTRARPALMDAT